MASKPSSSRWRESGSGPEPPPGLFRKVFYDSPAGKLAAYVSQVPQDGKKRPAIIWITGGDCNTIGLFEGTDSPGNIGSLQAMQRASTNPMVHFLAVKGADHFSILAPANGLIARKILADQGPTTNISFTDDELSKLVAP